MEANEMEAGSRDQGSQALQEFQRRHDDMGGAIAVGGFELQDDVTVWCASQAFVAQGRTGDSKTEETSENNRMIKKASSKARGSEVPGTYSCT